ncbi:hypothetical protein Ancab_033166, partial [Ancistrocladus abbreviatus]
MDGAFFHVRVSEEMLCAKEVELDVSKNVDQLSSQVVPFSLSLVGKSIFYVQKKMSTKQTPGTVGESLENRVMKCSKMRQPIECTKKVDDVRRLWATKKASQDIEFTG